MKKLVLVPIGGHVLTKIISGGQTGTDQGGDKIF